MSAGRDHIHHKLMQKFSPEGTLIIIIDDFFNTGFLVFI